MTLAPISLTPVTVPKAWGHELVICNNDEFCGKILHFKQGFRFSAHSHARKREVFYLTHGRLKLMTIDPETAIQHERILEVGDTVEIPRLLVHQITALEDSDLIEFSTHHEDSDSYRSLPGDSQTVAPIVT
jgi:mannose-6-phosphate isomerase-like protein (cupin superfamily)